MTAAGIAVPAKIDLELPKYLNNRGVKKLMFNPEQEIIDPFTPRKTLASKLR
jgi:nitrite reductase (cytochrome c-552)